MRRDLRYLALAACSSSALLTSACSTTTAGSNAGEQFALGRNAADEPCAASRSWTDPNLNSIFDASYVITCRNVAASRSLGYVRILREKPAVAAVEATLSCGGASEIALGSGRAATARRCRDSGVGTETVAITIEHNGSTIIGSAVPTVAAPLRAAILHLTGARSPAEDERLPFDIASLAPPPEQVGTAASATAFDHTVALQQGITLNHRGLHVEASRLLNDALSRLGPDASPALRAELSLEAGLADSNISFTEAADEHFARADSLMAGGVGEMTALLTRKRDTYRALDLLNRRQFRRALTALEQIASAPAGGQPLQSVAVLRSLNQSPRGADLAGSVAVPDTEDLHQLVIDAQANWARSIALLALGDAAGAERALLAADEAFKPLSAERINPAPVLWLKARLERQRGRLAARRGDLPQALAGFDRAIDAMAMGAVETGGTGNEPAIAETRLERAAILAQQKAPSDTIRTAYGEAIDALIASGAMGGVHAAGVEHYLDLLVAEASGAAREDTQERFFRAIQAIGEPAVARQMSRIQSVVTADPSVGSKVRDRADAERELTRLRYQIAAVADAQPEAVAELERQRDSAQERLLALDAALASNTRLGSSVDRPATIAEVRSALRPGEVYLKLTDLNRKTYAVLVAADTAIIYRLELPSQALATLAKSVRASIDGQIEQGKLVQFDVASSYGLFRLISGPAADRLLGASAIVIDPAGPLERLPAGILVTDRASVDWYNGQKRASAFDYTGVSFLAAKAALSTAVSPRSFIIARNLPSSDAPRPFIGFAEHTVPERGAQLASAEIDVGSVCSAQFEALRDLATRMNPIDRQEVVIAANALGATNAALVAGSDFTDTGVRNRGDLDQYAVLHFATHGLEEGVWGCSKSPPALVTSFGDSNSDGLLSFDEIAGLRLNANLVVLSACDTGSGIRSQALARQSGQEEAGSTLQGLVRAFLTANSRAVMATHWEVPAKDGTYDFIRSFYSTARAQNIGSSLQTAQRQLIAQPDFSHPFYWGAYFVVGDSSKMMLGRPSGG